MKSKSESMQMTIFSIKNIISLLCVSLLFSTTGAFLSACTGTTHACAVTNNGIVKCWGNNTSSYMAVTIPLPTSDLAAQVVCGNDFTCVRTSSGAVFCWGNNTHGQLGIGSSLDYISQPTIATNLVGASASLCAGEGFVCSLIAVSGYPVQCWGANNLGQLCTGDTNDRGRQASDFPLPTILSDVARIYCGTAHAVAILTSGDIRGWGDNRMGQLAIGIVDPPYDVIGIYSGAQPIVPSLSWVAKSAALGTNHSCFLSYSGTVECYGSNLLGQLGYPNISSVGTTRSSVPAPVVNVGFPVSTIVAYSAHTCVSGSWPVVRYGQLPNTTTCWGANDMGQLGLGMTDSGIGFDIGSMPPTSMNATTPYWTSFVGSASTYGTTMIILSDTTLRGGNASVAPHQVTRDALVGWGDSSKGQLLLGGKENPTEPILIPSILNIECGDTVIDTLAGEECDLGLLTDGQHCTPFCLTAPCLNTSNTCLPCYVPNFRYTADLAGCFLTTDECLSIPPLAGGVCANGSWSYRSITNMGSLTLEIPTSINGNYTQLPNTTLIVIPNASGSLIPLIQVADTAYIDGTLILVDQNTTAGLIPSTTLSLHSGASGNITILMAPNIQGTFSDVQTSSGGCATQSVQYINGMQALIAAPAPCPSNKLSIWVYIGVILGVVGIVLLLGVIGFTMYRRGVCRCVFRERDDYERIGRE